MFLIAALILFSSLALGMALYSMQRTTPARERLLRLSDGTRSPRPSGASVLREETPQWLTRWFGRISASPSGAEGESLRKRLLEAGYRRPGAPLAYTAIRVGLALAVPLAAMMFPATWALDGAKRMVVLLLCVGVGYTIPSYLLDRSRSARQRDIVNGLPDALDLMVVCVEAGLGVVAALDRVRRDLVRSSPVLCAEIELAIHEIRAGKTTAESLRALARRTGVRELNALAAMLIQTERFGTSVADTLRVHADALRVRRMQRAEELANKAPLKMLFPTVLIFVASMVVTLGPAMLEILQILQQR
jgi:tight adherence protein C